MKTSSIKIDNYCKKIKVSYNIKWKIVRRGEIFMKLYIGCDHGGLDLKMC